MNSKVNAFLKFLLDQTIPRVVSNKEKMILSYPASDKYDIIVF